MINAETPTVEGDAVHYIAEDDRGIELHVIAIPDDRNPDGLTVIHAMPTSYTAEESDDADRPE